MGAQRAAQGSVQQVGAGVVAGRGFALVGVHFEGGLAALVQLALGHFNFMHQQGGGRFVGGQHPRLAGGACQRAHVASLTAALTIERRARGNGVAGITFAKVGHFFACGIEQQGQGAGFGQALVAHKGAGYASVQQGLEHVRAVSLTQQTALFLMLAGALALFAHMLFKALGVSGEAALFGNVGHDIEREAVGVVQLEAEFTGNLRLSGSLEGHQFFVQ